MLRFNYSICRMRNIHGQATAVITSNHVPRLHMQLCLVAENSYESVLDHRLLTHHAHVFTTCSPDHYALVIIAFATATQKIWNATNMHENR